MEILANIVLGTLMISVAIICLSLAVVATYGVYLIIFKGK